MFLPSTTYSSAQRCLRTNVLGQNWSVCYCSCCYPLLLPRRHYRRRMFSFNYAFIRASLLLICLVTIFLYYNMTFPTRNRPVHDESSHSSRVMFVIRTSSHFYQKRLIYLLETWIPLVKDDAFFVTDVSVPNVSEHQMILTKNTCGSDAHSMSLLCCKTAHDFLIFHRHLSNYDWFCHFDDDQYVNVNNLKEYLSIFDANQSYYIGRASWPDTIKRSKEPYPHPFWFATLGAGVCLSKPAVRLLAPYTLKTSEFIDGCLRENYHDDIYLAFLLNAFLNISLTKTARFHSHLEKAFYDDKRTFLRTFTNEITFGFRAPGRYPYFFPQLYPAHSDPYRIRTLHCLLFTQSNECQSKIRQQLFNSTK